VRRPGNQNAAGAGDEVAGEGEPDRVESGAGDRGLRAVEADGGGVKNSAARSTIADDQAGRRPIATSLHRSGFRTCCE